MSMLAVVLVALSAARPPNAVPGKPVGKILAANGAVKVLDAKKLSFAAAVDVPVIESDTLVVPEAASVFVELANGNVVRIDEFDLPVADIALLNAPKASKTVAEQFEQLLTKDERAKRERLIGWVVSPTAASVVAVRPQEEGGGGPPAKSPAPPKQVASPPPPPPPPSPVPERSGSAMMKSFEPAAVASKEEVSLPLEALATSDAQLKACLETSLGAHRAAWAKTGTLKVLFRVEASGATRVLIGRALPTPDCAAQWLAEHQSAARTRGKWIIVEVPLK